MGRRRDVLEQPAEDLGARLRRSGRPDLQATITELLPAGAVNGDEHLPLLGDRLTRIADDSTLDQAERDEAARLAAVVTDLPTAIGRTGAVWIAWWEPRMYSGPGHYLCHWESGVGEQDEDLYEDGPEFATLDEALAWGRQRTEYLVVRPSWDSGSHYWAGSGRCPNAQFPPLTRRS